MAAALSAEVPSLSHPFEQTSLQPFATLRGVLLLLPVGPVPTYPQNWQTTQWVPSMMDVHHSGLKDTKDPR